MGRTALTGPDNPNWRGGRVVDPRGYVLIRVGKDHPLADVRGYAYEHRLVAQASADHPLTTGEQVHHRDEVKSHNEPANLELMPSVRHHRLLHRSPRNRDRLRMPGEPNPRVACACGCGAELERFDASGRPRAFLPGHNAHPSPCLDAVLAALRAGPRTRAEIIRATGRTKQAVACALTKLRGAGRVTPRARGVWALEDGNG